MKGYLICSFSLTVGLWVCNGSGLCLTLEVLEVVFDLASVELMPVIKDHCPWHTKSSDDILPNKLLHLNRLPPLCIW